MASSTAPTNDLRESLLDHIEKIWGFRDEMVADLFIEAMGIDTYALPVPQSRWDEDDVALITYGDSIVHDDQAPLRALASLVGSDLADAISIVDVLPFSPYSSDRGVSVIDYTEVDPNLGTWDDMAALAGEVPLMFDLVLNHCSASAAWFQQFLRDEEPGRGYIMTGEPDWDVSTVTRPRSTPLLSEFDTAVGPQLVWTTFSRDQVDLDWGNPKLVAEMLRIIDLYINRGARLLRLDAVAYIWKVPGTTSIHLPETHEIVKMLHTLLAARASEVSIITETNVPDRENRTYFGDSDEAHLIYNFTLPPLAIDAVLNGRADRLVAWMAEASPPPPGTTLFNFLASHDGIGVRPAEGFLSNDDIEGLVQLTHDRGGMHGTYSRNGEDRPYELNIAFPDLFGGPDDPHMVDRIILLHTIVLALAGVPAIYINSLMATTSDHAAVEADGIRRSINRSRVHVNDVPSLADDTWQSRLYRGLLDRAALRRSSPAFHPQGAQQLRDLDGVLAIDRTSVDGGEQVSVYCNMTDETKHVAVDDSFHCLLTGHDLTDEVELPPYGSVWLTPKQAG